MTKKQKRVLSAYINYINAGRYFIQTNPEISKIIKNKNNLKTKMFIDKYGFEVAKKHLSWLTNAVLEDGERAYIACLQNVSPVRHEDYKWDVYAFTYKDFETKSLRDQYYVKMLYNSDLKKIEIIIHESGDY